MEAKQARRQASEAEVARSAAKVERVPPCRVARRSSLPCLGLG